MILFKEAIALQQHLQQQRSAGKTLGFVPTMGALHDGHLSLIRQSVAGNDLTVCSIFVNPTQFNNAADFQHYPKTIEQDLEQLLAAGCDVLFLPPVQEIYPPHYQKQQYDLGVIETLLEGAFRPGHFQGVCQVMDRLLQLVEPHRLYMGQKDYQQCMVVRRLLEITGRTTPLLVIADTLREADGLAMSSRNLRLRPEDRAKAPELFQALRFIQDHVHQESLPHLEAEATRQLEQQGFAVDYVAIRNAQTLQPAQNGSEPKVALLAAAINGIRLIDNLPLN
jgi:pantoate--beta-alanine ligase